jgi:glycosyltransferase involved in cell wall biosynthesis
MRSLAATRQITVIRMSDPFNKGSRAPIRFSIFLPVRNGGQWLGGAVESVLAQTYGDWELVIGDNASEDDTQAVVARYEDARIRYQRFSDSVDIFKSYNRTFAMTRFEWVQELSADDRLHPECLAAIAERIESHRAEGGRRLAMVLTGTRRINAQGEVVDTAYYGYEGKQPLVDGRYGAASWLVAACQPGSSPWNFGSAAISREVLDELGRYIRDDDPIMSTDLELALTVAAYGDVSYIDRPLLDVTAWPESDTHGRHARDRQGERPLTARGLAFRAALDMHESRRHVSARERSAVHAAIARTNLQRAAGQRYLPGGGGRLAALRDVLRAARHSWRTVIAPEPLARAALIVLAPRSTLVAVRTAALARRDQPETAIEETPTRPGG